MGVSKLSHKTCPFSLPMSVYLSLDRSVQPPCLCYRSPLHVRSEQIGMKKKSNFTPQLEFLNSEIGIPIKRNFPAGREHYKLACSSVENTLYLPIVLQRTLCTFLLFCREHYILTYCSAENTIYLPFVLLQRRLYTYLLFCSKQYVLTIIVLQRTLCTYLLFCKEHYKTCLLFSREHFILAYCSEKSTIYLPIVLQRTLCSYLLFCREHYIILAYVLQRILYTYNLSIYLSIYP